MQKTTTADAKKRILFLSCVLGLIFGIGVYIIVKSVQQQRVALIAIIPLLLIAAMPMAKELVRLRRESNST